MFYPIQGHINTKIASFLRQLREVYASGRDSNPHEKIELMSALERPIAEGPRTAESVLRVTANLNHSWTELYDCQVGERPQGYANLLQKKEGRRMGTRKLEIRSNQGVFSPRMPMS
jgi:hypothetical protein